MMQKTRLRLALLVSVVLATGPSLSAKSIEPPGNNLPDSNATAAGPHLIPENVGKPSVTDAPSPDAEKSNVTGAPSPDAEKPNVTDALSPDAEKSTPGAEKFRDANAPSSGTEKPVAADAASTTGNNNGSHTPLMIDIDSAFLYTKGYENGEEYEIISADNNTISKSNFQAGAKTFIIIHGFQSWATKPWILKLKEKMLEKDAGSNVITVQWKSQAGYNFSYKAYNETLKYIQPLGQSVARLVEALHIGKRLDYKDVHVIGLNLGAHIAGFAGKAKLPFGRITGLDPASRGFLGTAAAERLDKADAYYVDIIHSNSCNNWNVWSDCFGIYQSIGHTDFWPNGGKYQPACHNKKTKGLRCDHTIVTDYFIESFVYSTSTTRFLARPAKNYEAYCHGNVSCGSVPQYMGIFASSSAIKGDYFLTTSKENPYALEDWRCPTPFRVKLYQTSCGAAKIFLALLGAISIPHIVLSFKYAYKNVHASLLGKNMYNRFHGDDYGANDNDRVVQPEVLRVDCRSPMSRFYEDLPDRPQTPMSIPDSIDTYASASEMNTRRSVRSDNTGNNQRDNSRSVEELVRHQDNLRRDFDNLHRNRVGEVGPSVRKNEAPRGTNLDFLCAESVSSSDAAAPLGASKLFNNAASLEGSIDLWREMEIR